MRDHVGVDVLVANDSSSRAQVLHEAVAVFVFQTKTAAARCYRHALQVAHVHSVLQHVAFSVCQFHSRAVRFLQTTVHVGDLVTAHVQVAFSRSAQCGGLARISFVTEGHAVEVVQVFGQAYSDGVAINVGHDVFTFVELRPIGVSSAAFHVNLRVQLSVVYITSVSAELQAVVQSSHFFLNGVAVSIFGLVNDTGLSFAVFAVNASFTLRHSHGAVRAVFAVDTDGTVFAVQSNASFTICTVNADKAVFTRCTVFARTTDSHIVVQANFQRFRAVSLRDHVGVDVLVANDSSSSAQVLLELFAVFVFQTKTAASICTGHIVHRSFQVTDVHSVSQYFARGVFQIDLSTCCVNQTARNVGNLCTAYAQVTLCIHAQRGSFGGIRRIHQLHGIELRVH